MEVHAVERAFESAGESLHRPGISIEQKDHRLEPSRDEPGSVGAERHVE